MAELSAAEYRSMSLNALKIASRGSERLSTELHNQGPDAEVLDELRREVAIALTHAGVYANLAMSRASEEAVGQLEALAVVIPASGPVRAPLHLRVLRRWWKVPTLRERLGR